VKFDLKQFEQWMFAVVTHREGVPGGLEAARAHIDISRDTLTDMVNPSPERTAEERLGVYANMYFWRLVDIMREDFQALHYAMGEDAFYPAMVSYLVDHPSRSYRLAPLGRHLPKWLAENDTLEHSDFLSDLASLERHKEDVFNEKRTPTLDPEALAAIPPDQWIDTRVVTVDALRLLAARYPVNAFFQDVMNDEEPAIPSAEPEWTVIWRQDFTVWRLTISEAQYTILSALRDGGTLGDALEACLSIDGLDPRALMADVGGWFQSWTVDGMFSAVG